MANTDFALDQKTETPGLEYLRWMQEATAQGKGLGGLVREIAGLMWGPGKLQPNEYFMYKLYDDQRYGADVKKTFLGAQRHHELLAALDMPWPKIANDKPTLTALLRGHELPIPETQAMRHAARTFPGAKPLFSREDVLRFLRQEAVYPLFTKPTAGACSLGVANIESYDADADCLLTSDGRQVSVEDFADQAEQFAADGYLFQSRLTPHPQMADIVGNRISTVRMFVLVDEQGPVLLRAAWKIPGAETVADNFWRAGNMLGGVDVETGNVTRVLMRTAEGTEPVEEHPVTGTKFDGLTFPEWDAMKDLVMRGAAAVPSCHLQGWDVALTDQGPVLIELEGDGGDSIMEQLCFDTGLLQGRYLDFLNKAMLQRKENAKSAKRRSRKKLWANLSQLNMNAQRSGDTESEPTTTHSA
ncbi:hypothetical protein CA54_57680 [Symmachiella macrocystis]|uniref:Alpha-L-glutamate ligase-related protein ATP-grasp domain-containing protein n=1 Tax=Symmachiella macrocystis TaxID=2527985 RepID=A0A5C6B710_9PLAN|nr:sugar-transfer associated ATP-grasp domain-containing protein [Symmachiella macrocystis]TWU07362.1 hypothetical protein CA54_57680 [Symmachiella macrocystis]